MEYFSGDRKSDYINANTATIPRIQNEPEGNMSFTSGNRVVDVEKMNMSYEFTDNLVSAIDQVMVSNPAPIQNANIVGAVAGDFGVFRR